VRTLSQGKSALLLIALVVVAPRLRGQITLLGVTTSAGFVTGLPGPGSPATIFCTGLKITNPEPAVDGSLPASIEGVTVTYGDTFRAPIYAVADLGAYQIVNFQVPWESHPIPLVLSQNGASAVIMSADGTGEMIAVEPAPWGEFFTTPDGFAVALHAVDYSLITARKPAAPGEWIILYASNLGNVIGPPATGSPASLDTLAPLDPGAPVPWKFTVWRKDASGDQQLTTNFLGLAPGLIGVYQVNVEMPAALPPGDMQIYIQRVRDCGFFFTQGCGRGVLLDLSATAMVP
jgi:uncharacterized protein (TIGR03437 family)